MYGGFVPEQDYRGRSASPQRMLSMHPSPPPTPPKPSLNKPPMSKLHIPSPDQEMQTTRLNQALPPIPLPSSPSNNNNNLAPPPMLLRPPRSPSRVSPAKPTRTMSHPILTHLSTQLPPSVPEEHRVSTERDPLSLPVSPLSRHPGASSPILERNSANSRYSMRRRASTSPSVVRRNSRPYNPDIPQEVTPLDDEALRYAEEIRKKRESKRRWKEAEDEDRVIIGNKVDANHPNYITAYNMLTGLRVAVHHLPAVCG